jgi:outer membrane protein assembly factor BamD (BamD/ComL family)
MSERQGYCHLVAYLFVFVAFSLWLGPSLPACSPQQTEAAQVKPPVKADDGDPFYRKLYEDGKDAFESGNVQEAVDDFEIAFFGYLDNLPRLLECYMYLAVGHYDLKNVDKCKADLDEIHRLNLEEHMATAAPSENLLKRFREVQGKFQKPPKRAGN